MRRIGISGHTYLTDETNEVITALLRTAVEAYSPGSFLGMTCLSRGADQIFAQVVLEQGGVLEVVLPSADYRNRKVKSDNQAQFDNLINQAAHVHTMPFDYANRHAYMAASEYLLDRVDELVAVWDGEPSRGYGGTADVVAAARERGMPVTVYWPAGAARSPS